MNIVHLLTILNATLNQNMKDNTVIHTLKIGYLAFFNIEVYKILYALPLIIGSDSEEHL